MRSRLYAGGILSAVLAATSLGGIGNGQAPSPGKGGGADVAMGRRIVHADAEPQNWLTTGRDYGEQRYSPLTQINAANAGSLGLVWSHDLDTRRTQESTPLAVDGQLYTTSAWSKLQAFDAVTGRLRWQFDPKVPGAFGAKACCDVVNRGAAYWNGRLYIGTIDGRLIAVDARSGRQLWSTQTTDRSKSYTITGAPRIVKGRVIIGNGGAEFGARGYVSAYDSETGKLVWRFYTVPGRPGVKDNAASDAAIARFAADSWSGEWWKQEHGEGGGTVWDSMAYDPELDLLYIGVGNGSYWNRSYRSPGRGDNLFISSILALRPETGEYVWHFQQVPGDQWDFTATQHMILADLTIDGRPRKVLMQAPKNGFFYILDRATGRLISAKPYVPVNWAKSIDPITGRPDIVPEAYYDRTGKPWIGKPGGYGAHNWPPMAFNRNTGLVYFPAYEVPTPYVSDPDFKRLPVGINVGVDIGRAIDLQLEEARKSAPKGYLLAWDPVRQKEVWRAPSPSFLNGGALTTAGNIVVQGDSGGFVNLFDATNGRKLWSFDAQTAILAAPISFAVKGRQYITIIVGVPAPHIGDQKKAALRPRVLTFALGGRASLPPATAAEADIPEAPAQFGTAPMIAAGAYIYNRTCVACHGPGATGNGSSFPSLRHSGFIADKEAFKAVLWEGALQDKGMPSFKANYSLEDLEALRAYLIGQAREEQKLP